MDSEKPAINDHKEKPETKISPEVINAFKNGDHPAFETIFHTFYPKVNTFIKMLIKNADLAQELSQQVFVDLWENRSKIDPAKNINAYIYTMARNTAITTLRQQNRFEPDEFDYSTEPDTHLTDDPLIAKETALLIKVAISKMPAKRQQVFKMSRFENKSNEEIARELSISRKMVEKHLRLAVSELRKIVGALFFLLL